MRPEMFMLYNARRFNMKYFYKIVFAIGELEAQHLRKHQTGRK